MLFFCSLPVVYHFIFSGNRIYLRNTTIVQWKTLKRIDQWSLGNMRQNTSDYSSMRHNCCRKGLLYNMRILARNSFI